MLRDAQVVAIATGHPETRVHAVQDAVALDVHTVRLLDNNPLLDGNAIALGAASRLIPRVRSRSFGRTNQHSGKAQGER
jgi:hypothetical protein